MQPMQSPESAKVARYDSITGQPLPPLYDIYTGLPLSNQPSREPTYTNQPIIPQTSYQQPNYTPSYQQPGISG